MMEKIKIFSPATIANISCGFDVLGLCLDGVGDFMELNFTDKPGVHILEIKGADLPLKAAENVAGVAAIAMLEHLGEERGVEIKIDKRIRVGSGIGSSSASAAGAVFAINALLSKPLELHDLIPFAMEGEKLATGTAHADNVAPALMGGITLVRSSHPLDVVSIHSPKDLYAVVIHPHIEVRTADARSVLKPNISLKDAITQWGNVAGLVAGFFKEDYDLISRSLVDVVVEPARSMLIPGFDALKNAAKDAGALGSGISGSGPSVFALCKGSLIAEKVAEAFKSTYAPFQIPFDIHLSNINAHGPKILP